MRSGFGKASTGLALVGLLGLAAGLAAGHLHLVQWSDGVRTPWAGLGLDVFAAALIGSGLVGLRGLLAERSARAPHLAHRLAVGVTAAACVVFAGIAGLAAWQAQPTSSLRPTPGGIPSVVSTQLAGPTAVRLLRLTISESGTITYQLSGRETGLPATGLRQPVPSGGTQTAQAAAALLQPAQADAATAQLRALAVGFVIVDGPGARSAIVDRLQSVADLTQISRASRAAVWRVDPAVADGGAVVVGSSRVWLERNSQAVDTVPSTVAHARSRTRIPAGPAGRDLVIAEGIGWRNHGTVTVDGHRVRPVVADGRLSYPMPASGGRLVIDPGVQHPRLVLGQAALAALLLFLAVPFGNRRSRRTL